MKQPLSGNGLGGHDLANELWEDSIIIIIITIIPFFDVKQHQLLNIGHHVRIFLAAT